MKRFAERLKHVMFIANMVLVTATIVPYVYGLSIEPSTGRCVNFSGEPRSVSVVYQVTYENLAQIGIQSALTEAGIKFHLTTSQAHQGFSGRQENRLRALFRPIGSASEKCS